MRIRTRVHAEAIGSISHRFVDLFMMEDSRRRENEPSSVTAGENELKSNLLLFLN